MTLWKLRRSFSQSSRIRCRIEVFKDTQTVHTSFHFSSEHSRRSDGFSQAASKKAVTAFVDFVRCLSKAEQSSAVTVSEPLFFFFFRPRLVEPSIAKHTDAKRRYDAQSALLDRLDSDVQINMEIPAVTATAIFQFKGLFSALGEILKNCVQPTRLNV